MKKRYKPGHWIGMGFAIGIPIGIPVGLLIGIILGNIGLGVSLGAVLSIGMGTAIGLILENKFKDHTRRITKKDRLHRRLMIGIGSAVFLIGLITFILTSSKGTIEKNQAEFTAQQFIDLINVKGSIISSQLDGKYWETNIQVEGNSVTLFIDSWSGILIGMDCPSGEYLSFAEFMQEGGDGSYCWK